MNKVLHFLLAFAAACALFACAKDPFRAAEDAQGGKPVSVTFTVDLGSALTKAAGPESTGMDDGSGTFNLYVAAFNKTDGLLSKSSRIGQTGYASVLQLDGTKATDVTLSLPSGRDYKVIFFAMHGSAYDVTFGDGNAATFAFKDGLKANDSTLDAFWAAVDVSASKTQYDVTLRRPFAQLNVLVPADNVPADKKSFSSAMSVKAPKTFDLFGGQASGAVEEIPFTKNDIQATPFGKYADTAAPYSWVGMNYVLVPATGKVEVTTFQEEGMEKAIAPGSVPVKVNGRTNLVGRIYGDDISFSFTVQVGPGFDGEHEEPIDALDTEIEMADGKTYTEANPYAFDASAGNELRLGLSVNGGHTFEQINAGAAQGEKVEAVSRHPEVATASVDGNEILITPVSDGQAEIVVHTPAYTKAGYHSQTFSFWVKITGVKQEPETPVEAGSDTIVFADLDLENGTQYTEPFTEGDMSVFFEGGANDGKYYDTGSGIRIYGDGSVTVSSELEIIKIEYTFHSTYCPDEATLADVSSGEYDLDTHTWTGSATEVTLTRETGSGHWRLQKVTVYYGADHTDAILEHSAPGAYMPGHERAYAAGADQYLREYDGDAVTFVLLNPDEDEQMVVSGFEKSCQKGSPVKVSVQWKKGTSTVLNGSWDMTVVKIEDGKAWLATRSGNGFIIKD